MNFYPTEIQNLAKTKATNLAIQQFQSPDSLENLKELQEKLKIQHFITENKLKTVLNAQIDESEIAMLRISQSYDTNSEIEKNFKTIKSKAQQSQTYEYYEQVKRCVITYKNVGKSMDSLGKILELQNEIKNIEEMIEKDYTRVYEAHEKIIKLEEIRDYTLLESSNEHSFYSEVFQDYFKNIDQCSEGFTTFIFQKILENDGVSTVSNEIPQLLVEIVRVIEEEEKRDLHRMEEMNKKQNQKNEKELERLKLKKYKERLFQIIDNEIKFKIQMIIYPKEDGKDRKPIKLPLSIILDNLSKLLSRELDFAQFDVDPCFPEAYKILEFYIKTFNKYIKEFTDELMKDRENLDYSDVLSLAYWMKIDYVITIEDFLFKDLQAINYNQDAQTLLDDFIIHKTRSMIEGSRIAIEQDFEENVQPLRKVTGYPYTPGCVELFTMINTQFDQVKESKIKRPDFIINMVKSNVAIVINYSFMMRDNIKKRVKTLRPLMLFAYTNNITLCRTLMDQYLKRLLDILYAEYHETISDILNPCYESFEDLLNACIETGIDIIQMECEEYWKLMFDKQWETDENPIQYIVSIIDQFHKHDVMEKKTSILFHERLLYKIIQKYLDSLILNKKPIKDSYGKDELTFEQKVEEDMSPNLELLFLDRQVKRETIQEIFLPITYLRSFIKSLTKVHDDIDKFPFALNEILSEYPQSWDALASIVSQCTFISNDMKKKMIECIDSSFKKEISSGTEPLSKRHAFSKYIKDYNIRDYQEKSKPIIKPKIVKIEKKNEVEEEKLEDLGIDINSDIFK